jgi:hypothetical protein
METFNYSRVRITTDKYADHSVYVGDVGYIIETYSTSIEVEFSRTDGTTKAILTLSYDEVESDPEPSVR